MNLKSLHGAVLFLISFTDIFSNTVIYRDGKVVYGKTEIKESSVIIAMADRTVEVPKKKILKIINQDVKDRDTLVKIMKKYLPVQKHDREKKTENSPAAERDLDILDLSFILEEIRKDEIRMEAEKKESDLIKGAAKRSAVFPGWGQFHKGQALKGIGYFLLTAGAFGLYFSEKAENTKYISHYSNPVYYSALSSAAASGSISDAAAYLAARKHYDDLRSDIYDSKSKGEAALLGAGIFWLANIADAYFMKSGRSFEKLSALCFHCDNEGISLMVDADRRRLNLSEAEIAVSFSLAGKY